MTPPERSIYRFVGDGIWIYLWYDFIISLSKIPANIQLRCNLNFLTVRPVIKNNRISYHFEVSGPWSEAFNLNGISGWYASASQGVHDYFIDFEENMEGVPASIAVIPFLCNVLPISWLYDAEIRVAEVDLDFYNSVIEFKQGYIEMYPSEKFGGRLVADKIILNHKRTPGGSLVFFSGGVDANFTLLSKLEQKPMLLTLWGSDIYFNDEPGWSVASNQSRAVAKNLNLSYSGVKTSFRFFINCDMLDQRFAKRNNENWWHGFQHGIGIISHAAPLAWLKGIDQVYISSSYCAADGEIKCASHPTIDSHVRFAGAVVHHYDFDYSRQQKINRIAEISNSLDIDVDLRVCWQSSGGKNCCQCEKCVRTIYGLLAENVDPVDFGFSCGQRKYKKIAEKIAAREIYPSSFWSEIVEKFIKHQEHWNSVPHVKALIDAYKSIQAEKDQSTSE